MTLEEGRSKREWVHDCGLLALVTALSSVLSLPRLGFYSDDWAFLRSFRFAPDQSLRGLSSTFAAENGTFARPLQGVYDTLLYRLFGLHPLGYHAAIIIVVFLSLCIFYFALKDLCENRLIALAVVLVYGLLPHYSTVRLWLATTQITVSMASYFLAVYADAQQLRMREAWGWAVLSTLCLIVSGLAYEAFLPLFLLSPLLIGVKHIDLRHRGKESARRTWEWCLLYLRNPPVIVLILWFKFHATPLASLQVSSIKNAFAAAVDLTFIAYGTRLPHILGTIWRRYWDAPAFVMMLVIVSVIALYLVRLSTRTSKPELPNARSFALTLAAGFVVTGLSYSYFWNNFGFGTGINNRVAVAAAVAVAFWIVALVGLLSRAAGRGIWAKSLFCVLIAIICGCAYWIDQTISSFWIEASRRQDAILREIKQIITMPPKGTSILLDGYCPWIGPGIIYEIDWDVTGVLALAYNDQFMKGDVLRPRMKISERGVQNLDGKVVYSFNSLYFYDVGKKQAMRIVNRETALQYQDEAAEDPRNACIVDESLLFGLGMPVW
jgi:hypothetical protein